MNSFSFQWIRNFLRGTFPISLVISLSVYAWLRLIFFEVPFSLEEDLITVVKVILTGWVMVIMLKGIFYSILGICYMVRKRTLKPVFENKWVTIFLVGIVLSAVLVSCDAQTKAGVKKDLTEKNWKSH